MADYKNKIMHFHIGCTELQGYHEIFDVIEKLTFIDALIQHEYISESQVFTEKCYHMNHPPMFVFNPKTVYKINVLMCLINNLVYESAMIIGVLTDEGIKKREQEYNKLKQDLLKYKEYIDEHYEYEGAYPDHKTKSHAIEHDWSDLFN